MIRLFVNTYSIRWNGFWGKFQVSHDEIGVCIAEFNDVNDAVEYCRRG